MNDCWRGWSVAGFPVFQSFDGGYGFPFAFNSEYFAGKDSLAVHDDGTCAAGPLITGYFSAGKTEGLPECMGQCV